MWVEFNCQCSQKVLELYLESIVFGSKAVVLNTVVPPLLKKILRGPHVSALNIFSLVLLLK